MRIRMYIYLYVRMCSEARFLPVGTHVSQAYARLGAWFIYEHACISIYI